MNKIDNFFKKKVDAITIEPRAEAWSKLEAKLSKKNKSLVWYRVAALLLLGGVLFTSIIWLQDKGEITQLAEKSKKEIEAKSLKNTSTKPDSTSQIPLQQNNNIAERNKTNKRVRNASQLTSPQIIKVVEFDTMTIHQIEPETIQTETVAAAVVEKPIVIEYKLESVKYLRKEVPVLAETGGKKNSLQKALDFARDAKNSDSPFGEIRQAKDDLFAMNFIKDKQKKQ